MALQTVFRYQLNSETKNEDLILIHLRVTKERPSNEKTRDTNKKTVFRTGYFTATKIKLARLY